jgi:hypothetical protein
MQTVQQNLPASDTLFCTESSWLSLLLMAKRKMSEWWVSDKQLQWFVPMVLQLGANIIHGDVTFHGLLIAPSKLRCIAG